MEKREIIKMFGLNAAHILAVQSAAIKLLSQFNRPLTITDINRLAIKLSDIGVRSADELLAYRRASGEKLKMTKVQWYRLLKYFETFHTTEQVLNNIALREAGYDTHDKVKELIQRDSGVRDLTKLKSANIDPVYDPQLQATTIQILRRNHEPNKDEFLQVVKDLSRIGIRSPWGWRAYKQRHGENWKLKRGLNTRIEHYFETEKVMQSCYIQSALDDAGYTTYQKVRALILQNMERKCVPELDWKGENINWTRKIYVCSIYTICMN